MHTNIIKPNQAATLLKVRPDSFYYLTKPLMAFTLPGGTARFWLPHLKLFIEYVDKAPITPLLAEAFSKTPESHNSLCTAKHTFIKDTVRRSQQNGGGLYVADIAKLLHTTERSVFRWVNGGNFVEISIKDQHIGSRIFDYKYFLKVITWPNA